MSFTAQLITHPDPFSTLQPEWEHLLSESMSNTPFQQLSYQKAWWEELGRGTLCLITLHDSENKLRAIAPLFLEKETLYLNGSVAETDYLDLIVRTEDASEAWNSLLSFLQEQTSFSWQQLDLCNIPQSSPSHTLLPQLATQFKLTHQTEIQEVCPTITLPDSFDAYLNQLDKRQRHEIKRKLRRAENGEEDIKIFAVTSPSELETYLPIFFDLLQKSTIEKNSWLNDPRRALFQKTTKAALEKEMLQLWLLVVDGEPAAALLNFCYLNRIWVYNSGLDPANFGWISAGVVLTAFTIREAIENGRSHFDFLRGNESYKYRFGAVDVPIHRHQLTRNQ